MRLHHWKYYWYGWGARIDVLLHVIKHPRHKILWRANASELCPGDIICETCNVAYWCRAIL